MSAAEAAEIRPVRRSTQSVTDPRPAVFGKRLSAVRRILVFASGKGGVGKSTLSTLSALHLANAGKKTGLLDLDFHGASDHLLLGLEPHFPEETGGLIPLEAAFGLQFMTIAAFTGEHGTPFRGKDISNAFMEILAVTLWKDLDYLVIDMPPGIGDEVLDLIRFIPRAELILVSTPDKLSRTVSARLAEVLRTSKQKILGFLYNRIRDIPPEVSPAADLPLLGSISEDPSLEENCGNPSALIKSPAAGELEQILKDV
jgi:ATP-binding protein involved in chromosome partitioning